MEMIDELKLDLACGDSKAVGYKGVDISDYEAVDYVMDLQQFPWNIKDESADEVRCSYYIEHIKHDNVALDLVNIVNESNDFAEFKDKLNKEEFTNSQDGMIKFINEVYRILKPGGKLTLIAPYYSSMRAFGDPTHVRYIADFSFYYFNKEWRDINKLSHYGINCDFDLTYSYHITNEMTLKSDEVRKIAFNNDLNVIDDIIVELIKR